MGPARGLIAAGLGMLVVLSACQDATVPKPPLQTQAVPSPAPPPAIEETSTDVESFLAETAVTRVDISQGARVALLLPLSGRHARVGQALLNAAQIALFDIAGDKFTLVVRDTAGTPQGAQAALRSALMEGVHIVLGPLFATSVAAIAPEVRAAGLTAIAFSNDRSVAGDGVFVMGLAPRPQVYRLIGFARSQGLTRFAVLAPRTPYGDAVVQALQEATLRNAVELSKIVSYQPNSADLSAEVRLLGDYDARRQALVAQRKVLAARPDDASKLALKRLDKLETLGAPDFQAVLLPTGGQRLQAIAPMLAYFDIDPAEVRYLGTSQWENPEVSKEPVLTGGWFTAPPPELWTSFQVRYKDTYGTPPPRVATLAYDAAALAAVLTRSAYGAGREPDFSLQALTQSSGFSGVDGAFRFLPSGEVQRQLAILTVRKGGGFEVLDPAPLGFGQLIN
jgi:ABC-type branched-subunit amino acid transport system substrate-binding protein